MRLPPTAPLRRPVGTRAPHRVWTDVFGNLSPAGQRDAWPCSTPASSMLTRTCRATCQHLYVRSPGIAAADRPKNSAGTWLARSSPPPRGQRARSITGVEVRRCPRDACHRPRRRWHRPRLATSSKAWSGRSARRRRHQHEHQQPGLLGVAGRRSTLSWAHDVFVVAPATGNDGSSSVTFPAGDRGVVGGLRHRPFRRARAEGEPRRGHVPCRGGHPLHRPGWRLHVHHRDVGIVSDRRGAATCRRGDRTPRTA